jgi:hypothetical protein
VAGMSVFVNIGARVGSSFNSSVTGIERRFGQMNRRLRIQAAETKLAFREMAGAMSPLAAMAAAGGLTMGLKGIFGNGAEFQHQVSMMKNMGRTSTQMSDAIRQSWATIAQVPTSTLGDNLKILNETTMAFGSFAHAADNLSFVQKMSGMMTNVLGDDHGLTKDSTYSLIKALEMRGMGTKANPGFDERRFRFEASQLYQAMISTSGKVTPEELFNFTKQASPFTGGLSNRFMYRIAPSLIQENGGDRAGTQISTFMSTINGKAKNKLQTEAWMKLGWLDPRMVVYNKVGPVGWQPGAVKHTDMALRDPLQFMETLGATLRARGTDTSNPLSLTKGLMPLFRDRNAFRMAYGLLYKQTNTNLHKDERLINDVPSLNRGYAMSLKNDPKMQMTALHSSFTNLETALGSAFFKGGGVDAINNVAAGINRLARVFDRHPGFAKGVVTLMGLGAVVATLKVFGIALRWVLSPFRIFGRLLAWFSSSRLAGMFVNGIMRLGPLAMRGLLALGPWLLRGVAAAFGLLSNPVGWAILAVSVGILIYKYRDEIAKAWTVVKDWFTNTAWPSVRDTIASIDWGRLGIMIADGLTFGLASRLTGANWKGILTGWATGGIGGAIAGAFASPQSSAPAVPRAGPRHAPRNTTIVPASMRAQAWNRALGGNTYKVEVNGSKADPDEIGRAVHRELKKFGRGQAANYND